MKNKFILCGVVGWCMEIFWTSLDAFRRRELKLEGHSSIWMFPIYGMAAFLSPIYKKISDKSTFKRGLVYTICIFTGEYITGYLLKKRDICPWDYSGSKFSYKGLIRLDYAPVWFAAGLLFERLLKEPSS